MRYIKMSVLKLVGNLSIRHGSNSTSDECDSVSHEEEAADEVFVPQRNKRPPKLGEIYNKKTPDDSEEGLKIDVNRYISFEIDDENNDGKQTPINVSSYFIDDCVPPKTTPGIEINFFSPAHDESSDDDSGTCFANNSINRLGVPAESDDDDLTDAEYSDNEKERQNHKKRLAKELSVIGSGFTKSAFGFYKVEDEEESEEDLKEERIIGKLAVPRLFNVVQEVWKPRSAETKKVMKKEETIEVDENFKKEAVKYGKYVLPGPDDYEEMIVDKVFVPCTNLDDEHMARKYSNTHVEYT